MSHKSKVVSVYSMKVRGLQNGKNTVKTQLYVLAMRGWIT